jgi:nitrite reductase/ring-hydroxylating ferredoxin subunit
MNDITPSTPATGDGTVLIPVEAYTSADYARAENDKLWSKVWQIACREEELKAVGDYVTYDILNESILIVRSAENSISAFYNVCPHRGRRITSGCGHANRLHCRFHGWGWNINGKNTYVLDGEDWGNKLTPERIDLKPVKVDTWGGWVWINMAPDSVSLGEFLEPAYSMLGEFKFERMRYRWRQWLYFPCNWKTALESFIESFHVDGTHPQLLQWGSNRWWCKTGGLHAWHGIGEGRGGTAKGGAGSMAVGAEEGQDPRVTMAELFNELWDTVGTSTLTVVKAADRLVDELPEGTPPDAVAGHLMQSAAMADAARGVFWPQMDPEHYAACGLDWHIFPNSAILPGITYSLCYRARPNGYDPDSCIFEVYILEHFPEGEEPVTEWAYEPDPTEEKWKLILSQDFLNIAEIQKGMKSRGYAGAMPSPHQELPIIHFHRNLARYMGTGAPQPLD